MLAVLSGTPSSAKLMSKRVGAVGVPRIKIRLYGVNPLPNPKTVMLILAGIFLIIKITPGNYYNNVINNCLKLNIEYCSTTLLKTICFGQY